MKQHIKAILLFCMVIGLVGCSNTPNTEPHIYCPETNYNNIYAFPHTGFWVDQDTVYYAREGFYNRSFHYLDTDGKHSITSTREFCVSVGDIDGTLGGGIQAFGDAIYFTFSHSNGTIGFYQYNKVTKENTKIFVTDKVVLDWTVYKNHLIYTTLATDAVTLDGGSLWCCNMNDNQTTEIAHTISAFGIAGGGVRFVKQNEDGRALLYHFDLQNGKSDLLCDFDGAFGSDAFYNFTDDTVVFGNSNLYVLQVADGNVQKFSMPVAIEFLTCYKGYAFMYAENSLYRVSLVNGETTLLQSELNSCQLLYAISDDSAVVICYDDEASLLSPYVKAYLIKQNAEMKKILEF